MAKPKVLISDELSPRAVEIFAERGCDVDFKPVLKPAELRAIIGNYEGLAIRSAPSPSCATTRAATTWCSASSRRNSFISAMACSLSSPRRRCRCWRFA